MIITSLSSDSINFELRGEKTFGLDGVAAVVFGANTGFAPDRQPRPRTIVALTTGERIEGKLMRVAESVCLRLDEGVEVEVPANKLLGLEVVSDKLLWMSELTPEVAQTPAFDRVWPWYVDRSQAGPGFKLAKRHYDRGLGMVPYTRLTYALAGRFDLFEATIGIDDRGGPEAHAIFRVFVDGKKAFTSEAMTRGQTPQVIRIVLNRAQSMALEVDFGKNFDLGDYCVFADARVTQQ